VQPGGPIEGATLDCTGAPPWAIIGRASNRDRLMRTTPGTGQECLRGGKAVYGASVGILILEARFPRIPGDAGNAATWPFPVLYRVVRGASPRRVVHERARGLREAFCAAAEELVAAGADGITTTCGFLSLIQGELAARCAVPVAASPLMQVALAERLLAPGRRAGVVTISAESLTSEHLAAAGAPPDTPIAGLDPDGELARVILGDGPELDPRAGEREVIAAGERLLAAHPEVGAIVLECTNLPPYAAAIAAHTGLPVFDCYSFVTWFQAGLAPRRW